jgi:hypothetical protein
MDPTAHQVAERDQMLTGMRVMASWLGDLKDAFLMHGFSDEQAFIASMTILENHLGEACHGPD